MRDRSVFSIAAVLGKLSRCWMDKDFPFRKKAAERLVRHSGFSEAMAEALLDATFAELTEKKLLDLLRSEIGDPRCLDGFRRDPCGGRDLRARGPESIVHVFSSNIPNAAVWSFVFGLLIKSRNIGKLSSRDEGFLDLYLASLKAADRSLASQNRLVNPSDRRALPPYIKEAGLVIAYGSDESLGEIRRQVPAATPFFGYGHRISLGLYFKEALKDRELSKKAACDVWMADQRGCLSPVSLYVEQGGALAPSAFAVRLAEELARLQKKERSAPRRDAASAAAASRLRDRSLIAKLKGKNSFFVESSPRGRWVVHYEEMPRRDRTLFCPYGAQIISVRGFSRMDDVFFSLKPISKYLQCVALECDPPRRKSLAEKFSALGANRLCRAGQMQLPPLTWHHDGKPNLASWVRWTDLEK